MSFRNRLRLFFAIIVLVPMAAVAVVLLRITADSERGKSDARVAASVQSALAVEGEARADARDLLPALMRDRALARALERGPSRSARARLGAFARRHPAVRALELRDPRGALVARTGDPAAVAFAVARPERPGGEPLGTLALSTTAAAALERGIVRHTGLAVRLSRGERLLSSSVPGDPGGALADHEPDLGEHRFRGRVVTLGEVGGEPLRLALLEDADALDERIDENRLLVGAILLGFLALALVSSILVGRALQRQIEEFLGAARRLARGDFSRPIPVHGSDEFAAFGTEFNRMSGQLAGKIEEVERSRRQLEQAIRRVGDAFAAGLDRAGVVELAVATVLDALGADAGRAVPVDPDKMPGSSSGQLDDRLRRALEAAERQAFAADPTYGLELLAQLDKTIKPPEQRRPVVAEVDDVHALALPLRAQLGEGSDLRYVGVVSIARDGREFSARERDLFGYLAGQAVVSIENVDLHETVQMQALTDELTRLYNVRHFQDRLDGEIERSSRFGTEVGLVMVDIDDFKRVNDTHGHQQGDLVLVEVARVLRELSRDIDVPARYGGEELAIVLPQTDVTGAEQAAERMRAAVEALRVPHLDGGEPLRVTASFGVAALPSSGTTREALVAAADAALYRAKRAGKNRVMRAEGVAA
jgi:diguanylate cyclase (GGDEF)-like protein